jgi:Leucine-rich repeat (LRR) protein
MDSSIDLSVCTWLHRLTISNCQLHSLPKSITLLTDLVELDLIFNHLTSIDAIDFVQMSKLSSLEVSNYVIALWKNQFNFLCLYVKIAYNRLGPSLRNNWNDATSLSVLDLAHNRLSSIDNLRLSRMTRLYKLDVSRINAESNAFDKFLQRYASLKAIHHR